MARGWESKNVESQQDEAQRARPGTGDSHEPPEVQVRRRTLELALARARADLQSARAPAHRKMLEQAIEALSEQLSTLGAKARSRKPPAASRKPT